MQSFKGTSINDVQWFWTPFPNTTYYVLQFLTYNIQFSGIILDPLPTLKLNVINERLLKGSQDRTNSIKALQSFSNFSCMFLNPNNFFQF